MLSTANSRKAALLQSSNERWTYNGGRVNDLADCLEARKQSFQKTTESGRDLAAVGCSDLPIPRKNLNQVRSKQVTMKLQLPESYMYSWTHRTSTSSFDSFCQYAHAHIIPTVCYAYVAGNVRKPHKLPGSTTITCLTLLSSSTSSVLCHLIMRSRQGFPDPVGIPTVS